MDTGSCCPEGLVPVPLIYRAAQSNPELAYSMNIFMLAPYSKVVLVPDPASSAFMFMQYTSLSAASTEDMQTQLIAYQVIKIRLILQHASIMADVNSNSWPTHQYDWLSACPVTVYHCSCFLLQILITKLSSLLVTSAKICAMLEW